MKNIEILAPAGSKESFIAAINAGANAVYLAGSEFGARKYASNFSKEEIKDAIIYAHVRNVKVFVTVNTIIFENEVNGFLEYTDFLVQSNVDALIVQDLGMIEKLCRRYPDTEIHASTQMNAYNVEQVRYLKSIGVKRVILARETSINDIRRISNEVDIDLEVFVHGALCVSYSGNCLFSYLNGGRSGNRGECAQPCRLRYSLQKDSETVSDDAYLMSTKDLLTIDHLERLIDSGIVSFKIEGRMKKPSYVVSTVKAYKEAVTNIGNQDFDVQSRIRELMTSFNREYTKGFILNELPYDINNSYRPNHQGIQIGIVKNVSKGKIDILLSDTLEVKDGVRVLGKKDHGGQVGRILLNGTKVEKAEKGQLITIDLLGTIEVGSKVMKTQSEFLENQSLEYLKENYKLINLTGEMICEVNKPIHTTINHPVLGTFTYDSDYIVQVAQKNPATKEKIAESFDTFGNTPYYLSQFTVHVIGDVFIPNKVLKAMRRSILSMIEEKYNQSPRIIDVDETPFEVGQTNDIIIKVENKKQFQVCKDFGYKNVFPTINSGINSSDIYSNRIVRNYQSLSSHRTVVIQDYGGISLNTKKIANYTMNVVNSDTVHLLHKNNVDLVTVSLESTFQNTMQLISNYRRRYQSSPNLEVLLFSRVDLMISKYCPITKSTGKRQMNCGLCEESQYKLVNELNEEFPLIRDYNCNIRVLSNKLVERINDYHKYKNIGVNNFRLEFTTETPQEVKKVLRKLENILRKDR